MMCMLFNIYLYIKRKPANGYDSHWQVGIYIMLDQEALSPRAFCKVSAKYVSEIGE